MLFGTTTDENVAMNGYKDLNQHDTVHADSMWFASVEYVKLDSLILKLFIKWVTSMCPNLKIG